MTTTQYHDWTRPALGLVPDLPDATYRGALGASASGLKGYLESPRHGVSLAETGLIGVNPDTLVFGRLCHTAVLEPDRLDLEWVVAPAVDRRTKAGKEIYAEFLGGVGDRTVVSESQWLLALAIRDQVLAHPLASAMLEEGQAEVSCFWETDGTPSKGRLDWVREDWQGHPLIFDLKTCKNASPKEFAKQVANFKYHLQAAYYSDGYEAVTGKQPIFVFAAVEKTPPYAVGVYEIDALAIDRGREAYQRALSNYREAAASVEAGVSPRAYSDSLVQLSLPPWA